VKRRDFLRGLGWGVAVAMLPAALKPGMRPAGAASPLRLACLSDAHLADGRESRPEARALARAVAEVGALSPRPDLVLFAGDLAAQGDAGALALGRELLQDLPAPLLAVRGEGDGHAHGLTGRFLGPGRFSHRLPGLQLVGLDTTLASGPGGAAFAVGREQLAWLDGELSRLHPDQPLLVLSHAPLEPLYYPWRQWTLDGPGLLSRLRRFRRVFCLHGHVHRHGPGHGGRANRGAGAATSSAPRVSGAIRHHGLLATSWPLPWPLMGTPARLTPVPGDQGCGWSLLLVADGPFLHLPCRWPSG